MVETIEEETEKKEEEDVGLASPPPKAAEPEYNNAEAEEEDAAQKEEVFNEINTFLRKYTPATAVRGRTDTLDDRYLIKTNAPLPELDTKLSQAYEVVDEAQRDRELYALVCDPELPYRIKNMQELLRFEHPNVVELVACGPVELSQDNCVRLVAVHEKPKGRTLREILQGDRRKLSNSFLIDEIIAPLNDVLLNFAEKGVCHANLNLDTVYYGDRVQLGPCVAEPAGCSQDFYFESTERSQTVKLGKGETSIATDCYALGILVLHMLLGMRHFEKIDQRQYTLKRLTLGSYNILVGAREFKALEDFFKGVLNDNTAERWTPSQIDQWVKGKKYNLLTPSVLREAQRPFMFMEEDYFNRRALAHALAENWEEAKTALRNTYLSRWVEVSLHKEKMAEDVRMVMERTGGVVGKSERANNELVARTICILDPEGPVRYVNVAAFVDGMGVVLADAFRTKSQKMIQSVIEILDYNFFNYINELLDGAKNKAYSHLLWKLQSCSRYLRMQAMGFGIERILYELNPSLSCQSPLLKHESVLTIDEMLGAIDRMGTRKQRGFDYLDRHIAAFLATKLDITKEVKMQEMKVIPALAQNPQLIVLNMLAQAQRKAGRPKLKGLSSWAALKVLPLIDNFHSHSVRKRLRSGLRTASRSGDLDKIFDLLKDQHMLYEDHQGYRKAVARFTRNAKKIIKLESAKRLQSKADQLGTILAIIIAYTTLLVSISLVVQDIMQFG